MAKAELKTKKTQKSVSDFLNAVPDKTRRRDSKTVLKIMHEVTKKTPKMWGPAIVGFGDWHYKYPTGREGDYLAIGFSPRKAALSIYIMPGYSDYSALLNKLGPYKKGKSCLYIKNLDDIHVPTLKKIITKGWKEMQAKYGVK